ncbi:MAG: hypothetical protein ACC645_00580 [Pirellulales bacterium]
MRGDVTPTDVRAWGRISRAAGWIVLWTVALYGTLQIARLSGPWDHAICGPWGCGPPLSALVACHAFWSVLIGGTVMVAVRCWSGATLATVGRLLAVGGLIGLVVLAIWGVVHGSPAGEGILRPYLVQRYLFVLLTSIDTPIVELTVAGGAMVVAGRGEVAKRAGGANADGSAGEPGEGFVAR